MLLRTCLAVATLSLFFISSVAKVTRVEITSKEDVMEGREFGDYGAYELLKGTIFFEFEPFNVANRKIVDIAFAPKNASGNVEAWSNIVILTPQDPSKSSGIALVEVSNRGGKFSPRYFNRTGNLNPKSDDDGIGLLMKQGLTVIWIGWQFDVPDGENILKLHPPVAKNLDGTSIEGLVRSDWTIDDRREFLSIGHRNQVGYKAARFNDLQDRLTLRSGRTSRRIEVPRDQWKFARVDSTGQVIPDPYHIYVNDGFKPGFIYELVYHSENPVVVGLGLAVIRDVISYVKYHPQAICKATKGIAVGVSQTGRFLRQFLYQNFNIDESNRPAYDGFVIITAGAGRGSFNHRFAQPSRDGHPYSAFFYPTDIYPFSGASQFDPVTFKSLGLLNDIPMAQMPKIFYINTGYEYWGRAASLIHTSTDGSQDINPLPNERIYHLASGQHYVGGFPPEKEAAVMGPGKFRGNSLDFSVNYRALLVAMINWVSTEKAPPNSRYPRIADSTLVTVASHSFPKIPGVKFPTTPHTAYRMDFGKRWVKGIIDNQPPKILETFTPLVPATDSQGNELGGVRNVEVEVPLATYTPWNLRSDFAGGRDQLINFRGSYIPLPRTSAQKKNTNDPRPSIKSLYKNKTEFLEKTNTAARELVEAGFLLTEEIPYVMEKASRHWDWIHKELPKR
ncbi:MAG: alpha/beta hydrolase domain-containing protein [Cyclobacteriaceae bacterium]|nr:alpha/beta hydrolase domain-containing protein [Cyclobacteriaceae bacterium]